MIIYRNKYLNSFINCQDPRESCLGGALRQGPAAAPGLSQWQGGLGGGCEEEPLMLNDEPKKGDKNQQVLYGFVG